MSWFLPLTTTTNATAYTSIAGVWDTLIVCAVLAGFATFAFQSTRYYGSLTGRHVSLIVGASVGLIVSAFITTPFGQMNISWWVLIIASVLALVGLYRLWSQVARFSVETSFSLSYLVVFLMWYGAFSSQASRVLNNNIILELLLCGLFLYALVVSGGALGAYLTRRRQQEHELPKKTHLKDVLARHEPGRVNAKVPPQVALSQLIDVFAQQVEQFTEHVITYRNNVNSVLVANADYRRKESIQTSAAYDHSLDRLSQHYHHLIPFLDDLESTAQQVVHHPAAAMLSEENYAFIAKAFREYFETAMYLDRLRSTFRSTHERGQGGPIDA